MSCSVRSGINVCHFLFIRSSRIADRNDYLSTVQRIADEIDDKSREVKVVIGPFRNESGQIYGRWRNKRSALKAFH